MATTRVYTESVVTLNNQEAVARIDELKTKAAQLHAELYKIAMTEKEGIKSKAWQQKKKELDAMYASMKSINEEHKKFDKILNDINGSSYNDLTKAARMLEAQVKKLKPGTEQFVAASKKLKEVRTRMKEIDDQTRETQLRFGSFFSKIKWTAIVAGGIAAFKKLGKDMTEETFRISSIWKRETAAWKAMYGEFVASIGSGKGWQELISDMATASNVARDYQSALAEIYRMNNALQIQESELAGEIQENRQKMYDTSLSPQEREAAAQAVIDAETKLAEERQKIAARQLAAENAVIEARAHMDEEERTFFIEGYNRNHELIQQAYEYKAALEQVSSVKQMIAHAEKGDPVTGVVDAASIKLAGQYREELAGLEGQIAGYSDEVVRAYGILQKYNQLNGEMVDSWVKATVQANTTEAELTKTMRRAVTIRNRMRQQEAQEAAQAQAKAYQDALKASEDHFRQLQNELKQSYLNREISEQEYQVQLAALQKQGLEDRLDIAERYKQSVVEIQSQILDLSIAQRQKIEKIMEGLAKDGAKIISDMTKEAQKAIDDFLKDQEKELQDLMGEVDAMMGAQLAHELDLIDRAKEARTELYPLDAIRAQMNSELEALEEMHEKALISEKEYQQRRVQLSARYGSQMAEAAMQYTSQASAFIDALQEAASARLEAQMQAELTAAGDNAEKRSEIEADYEQRKLDLEKRYADVDMAIKIANTTASGAAAAVRAYEEGGPYAGPALATLIAATTAMQIATIVAQRNIIQNSSVSTTSSSGSVAGTRVATAKSPEGYSSGGYTRSAASDSTPAGIVHANEWVAPAAMVRANPIVFAQLERARIHGGYQQGASGFASGGYTSDGDVTVGIPGTQEDRKALIEIRDRLNQIIENPIKAYVVLSEMQAAKELSDKIKKTAGKR